MWATDCTGRPRKRTLKWPKGAEVSGLAGVRECPAEPSDRPAPPRRPGEKAGLTGTTAAEGSLSTCCSWRHTCSVTQKSRCWVCPPDTWARGP